MLKQKSNRWGIQGILFLCLLLAGVLFCSRSYAITYDLDEQGTLRISGTGAIANSEFEYREDVVSVIIEEGVTRIGRTAFYQCHNIKSVTIPQTVTYIDIGAFGGCSSIESIIIPEEVESIGAWAFTNCGKLTSVTLPKGLKSIDYALFANCSNLKNINLPEGLEKIGKDAFDHCTSLEYISIPDSVKSIDEEAFNWCSGLSNITIPDSVTSIGKRSFYSCRLKNVTIPEKVQSIGKEAFDCYGIEKVAFMSRMYEYSDNQIFGNQTPKIFCYSGSAVEVWASSKYDVYHLDDEALVREISFRSNVDHVAIGETVSLPVEIFPNDHANITWHSDHEEIARVNNGIVTAVGTGQANITAAIGDVAESTSIEVYSPASSFKLSADEKWLQAGEGFQITVAVEPKESKAYFSWTSSDETIARVDQNGLVTTIKQGDVTITATTEQGITQSCILHLCFPVTAIAISPETATIYDDGDQLKLVASVTTRDEVYQNKLLTFRSENESIATVDENGIVTGIGYGNVKITATAYSGIIQAVEITVICREHKPVIDERKSPTLSETGLTAGSHCEKCGEILKEPKVTPALGNITVLWLPGEIKGIEEEAFAGIIAQAVIIPDGCKSIGAKAFAGCENLMYVYIPLSVETVAADAFDGCSLVIIDRQE